MIEVMKIGGGGCISASCNSNVAAIRAMFDRADAKDWEGASAMVPAINAHRQAAQRGGLIPALKSFKAYQSGDARWLNLRAPLEDADPALGAVLAATVP